MIWMKLKIFKNELSDIIFIGNYVCFQIIVINYNNCKNTISIYFLLLIYGVSCTYLILLENKLVNIYDYLIKKTFLYYFYSLSLHSFYW